MSKTTTDSSKKIDTRRHAMMFAALGDDTRLKILVKLRSGTPQSIKQLSADLPVTRQAVTRHLRVLEEANFVAQEIHGRERRFVACSEAISEAHDVLNVIAQQWEDALVRLKSFAERKQFREHYCDACRRHRPP